MDAKKIVADLALCRKAYELFTHPTLAIIMDKRGKREERLRLLRKLEERLENLEFAEMMKTTPVVEPKRILKR